MPWHLVIGRALISLQSRQLIRVDKSHFVIREYEVLAQNTVLYSYNDVTSKRAAQSPFSPAELLHIITQGIYGSNLSIPTNGTIG